jgi:hypothetical protein
MAKRAVHIELVDVDGSFKRFITNAPKKMQAAAASVVTHAGQEVLDRMRSLAPVLTGDMRGALSMDADGKSSVRVGVLTNPEQAAVALYNEYTPNQQPFMRPALEAESTAYVSQMKRVLAQAAAKLEGAV